MEADGKQRCYCGNCKEELTLMEITKVDGKIPEIKGPEVYNNRCPNCDYILEKGIQIVETIQ